MNKDQSLFYLVREEILPEAIKKTIKVKDMLKRGEVRTINEAVEKMDLSRSAYYKYKDFVFPFYEASKEKTNLPIEDIYFGWVPEEEAILGAMVKDLDIECARVWNTYPLAEP